MTKQPTEKEIKNKVCEECGKKGEFEWDAGERDDGQESLICKYCRWECLY